MNTHKSFTALFATMLVLGSTATFAGDNHAYKAKPRGPYDTKDQYTEAQSAPRTNTIVTHSVPGEIEGNSHIRPYLPQKNLLQIHESRSSCYLDGAHAARVVDRETPYTCVDYRSNTGVWRVVFGPGPNRLDRIARKAFEQVNGNWVALVEFDTSGRLVFESSAGKEARIASQNGEKGRDEPQQARENENSSPIKGLPNIGGIPLGTILNEVIKKGH